MSSRSARQHIVHIKKHSTYNRSSGNYLKDKIHYKITYHYFGVKLVDWNRSSLGTSYDFIRAEMWTATCRHFSTRFLLYSIWNDDLRETTVENDLKTRTLLSWIRKWWFSAENSTKKPYIYIGDFSLYRSFKSSMHCDIVLLCLKRWSISSTIFQCTFCFFNFLSVFFICRSVYL